MTVLVNMRKIRGKWKKKSVIIPVKKVRNKEMTIRKANKKYSYTGTLGDKLTIIEPKQEITLKTIQ